MPIIIRLWLVNQKRREGISIWNGGMWREYMYTVVVRETNDSVGPSRSVCSDGGSLAITVVSLKGLYMWITRIGEGCWSLTRCQRYWIGEYAHRGFQVMRGTAPCYGPEVQGRNRLDPHATPDNPTELKYIAGQETHMRRVIDIPIPSIISLTVLSYVP